MSDKVANIYLRLSDKDRNKKHKKDDSESIQNQKEMLIAFCKKNGWKINTIYSDEDYSGADRNRPEWNKLLKDCEEGRCSIVVCKTQSRFSRDMEMVEKYIHGKFLEWGVRFVGVVDNIDTEQKNNKKARQINGLVNEWYLEDLSENIKLTLDSKRKSGKFVGSFAPYGYLVDPDDKNHLIIDETAAAVIKRIFNLYIQGFGYINIAKALNDDNISPPCVRKKELGSKYFNSNYEKSNAPKTLWSASAVYTILRRQEYTGALVQGKGEVVNYKTGIRRKKAQEEWDIVENKHEPIISKEIFSTAQKIRHSRGKGQKIPDGESYFFARKIFCYECGNTMWKMSYKLRTGRYNYLLCKTRKTSRQLCENEHSIRLDTLEKIIIGEINKLLKEFFDIEQIGKIEMVSILKKDRFFEEIKKNREIINRNNKRISKMYIDKLDGVISQKEFTDFHKLLIGENQKCEKNISCLEEKIIDYDKNNDYNNLSKIFEKYIKIERLTFFVVDEFINKIFIGKQNNNTREIKIVWKI